MNYLLEYLLSDLKDDKIIKIELYVKRHPTIKIDAELGNVTIPDVQIMRVRDYMGKIHTFRTVNLDSYCIVDYRTG